jgi:hypothetical protein
MLPRAGWHNERRDPGEANPATTDIITAAAVTRACAQPRPATTVFILA